MKRVLVALLLGAAMAAPADAQIVRQHKAGESRALHGGAKTIRRSFKSDSEAQKMFAQVLRAAGLGGIEDRIQLRASAETDNAVAFIEGEERFIFYNAVYMQRLQDKDKNYWPLLAILAHEIGHHVRFHTQIAGRNHEFELEADYQAGFILRRMGATLDQAISVFRTFPKASTVWHPGRDQRIQMVTLGWREGGNGAAPAPPVAPLSKPAPAAPRSFAARLRALPQGRGLKEFGGCPEMVAIPGGRFMMGSPKNEPWRSKDEGPQRLVTIQPFAMGKYEVTFAEWDSCAADGFCRSIPKGGEWNNGDQGWGRVQRPAITISWNDIKGEAGDGKKGFLAWLNSKVEGAPYRLPTEAEWEYAARAGKSTPFWWGRSITPDQANYNGNVVYKGGGSKGAFRGKTVPVQSFQPNPFGLYQVHGNVYEWVEDCWNADYSGAPSNGSANKNGECSRSVLRGGSWSNVPRFLRSANRLWYPRDSRNVIIGFRVARTLRE